jgi:soluble lytic murein transglycosylase-like protein
MMFEREISDVSTRYNLPVGLIHATVQTESGGNPWAIRYEPNFRRLYLDNRSWPVFGPISMETEIVARATSWGLMQVMGQVARERGCTMAFLSELCRPEAGLEYGCRQLRHFYDRYFDGHGWNGVIAAYNAGQPLKDDSGAYRNQQYVNKVRGLWAA